MESFTIILVSAVLLFAVNGGSIEGQSELTHQEMPIKLFRNSGLFEVMQNETLYAEWKQKNFKTAEEAPGRPKTFHSRIEGTQTFLNKIERVSGAQLFKHADCKPYEQLTTLTNDKPDVVIFPSCILLNQCGGCCGHSAFVCRPTATREISVQVDEYSRIDKNGKPDVTEISSRTVVEHTKCECQCRVTAADCDNSIHEYDNFNCKCKCKKPQENCPTNKKWDEKVCACRCVQLRECAKGYIYNWQFCRCEKDIERAAIHHLTSGGNVIMPPNQYLLEEGRTSPRSTTLKVTTTEDPCADHPCPKRTYEAVVDATGTCQCKYIKPSRSRGSRRQLRTK